MSTVRWEVLRFPHAAANVTDCDSCRHWAGAAQDKTIKVWSIRRGAELRSWSLPQARKKRGTGGGRDATERVWLTHGWLSPTALVTTSHSGDLLLWTVDLELERSSTSPSWRGFSGLGHAHAVFSVCPSRGAGGTGAGASGCITISSDRQVVGWSADRLGPEWRLPTIGGHVYAIDRSLVDPTTVSIGCGDNLIRVWQTEAKSGMAVQALWKGIQSRVRAIRWHQLVLELSAPTHLTAGH